MTKRKKITIVLCTLLIILIGWLGYSKYKEEKIKQNQAYLELYVVYQSIKVKGVSGNPLIQGWTVDELLNNPPPVEIDGSEGLYLKSFVYTLYTGKEVDFWDIQEMMNTGQGLEVYTKYKDYIDWTTLHNNEITNFGYAVVYACGIDYPLDANSSYEDYNYIIKNRYDKIKEWYAINNIPFGDI